MAHGLMQCDLGEDVHALCVVVYDRARTCLKPLTAGIDREAPFPATPWPEMMGALE